MVPAKPFPKAGQAPASQAQPTYWTIRRVGNGYQLVSLKGGVEAPIGQPNLLLIVMDELLTLLRESVK